MYCIYVASTALRYFILFWEVNGGFYGLRDQAPTKKIVNFQGELEGGMGRFHILFLFFVAVMFAISLVSLFGYHLYLVTLNRTTLGK